MNIVDEKLIFRANAWLSDLISMTMHKINHKACINAVHNRVVKAKGGMITGIRVIFFDRCEKFDLY